MALFTNNYRTEGEMALRSMPNNVPGKGKATTFTAAALQRRLTKHVPGYGENGPRGGKKELSPNNAGHAGSMWKPSSKATGMIQTLQHRPIPK